MKRPLKQNPYTPPESDIGVLHQDAFVARLAFWPVYRICLILTAIAATPILIIASRYDLVDIRAIVPAVMIAIALQGLVIRMQTVRVTSNLIRCADFWGRYRTLQLSTIEKIRPTGWRPFYFLKLEDSTTGRTLWLPLFLAKSQAFWRFILDQVDPSYAIHECAHRQLASANSDAPAATLAGDQPLK